jgi:class 3 adenylate cyclase/tetratricopeptide (TPR) repeat protein
VSGARAHRTPGEGAAPIEPAPLDGERKTVTALFADIKGSTELERDLDPEEARAIVDPALKLMIDAVRRYDGYIVQSTGDGIFALFGAPVAHEDHPQRALYAAIRMQEDVRRYADKLRAEGRSPLQIRIGADTGEVVVRTIETGGKTEYSPIGHAANLASRMQSLANPGSTVISESTRKLVEGYFALKSLGASRVKGIAEPVPIFEVAGLGPLRTRLQRSAGRGLTKFVGREREMQAMTHAAEQARAGRGQIVAAVAEPGVGKSRLFYEFKVKHQSGWMVLEAFSVSHGKASAYLPVIDLLHSYFDIMPDDEGRRRREKVTGRLLALDRSLEDALPYAFGLLGLVEGDDPLAGMNAQVRRRRTLDAVKRVLLRESLNQPLMVMFEDLHWIDEETQAFLNLLADSIGTAKVLLLVNYRPEYSHQWGSKTYYTQLRLDPLGRESAEEMLASLLGDGKDLAALKRLIIDKSEGTPFFMEEMVQALYEEGALVRNGGTHMTRPLEALKIPPTVQAILAARIDRLPAAEKELLQTLSVMGKEFPLALVREVAARADHDELDRMLEHLQLAEFIYEQPAVGDVEYTFKHALTLEVAYNSLLQERRRALHECIGGAIEALYADTLDDHIEQLAHHYRRSADAAKAVQYLRLAGEQAARRSSPREAIGYLREALERIGALPAADQRDRAELEVQFAIGSALTAESWGAPDKMRAFERVSELAARTGAGAEVFPALWHLAEACISQGRLARAHELARQAWRLAESSNDRRLLLGGHHLLGETAYWMGNFSESRSHLAQAAELYDHAVDGDLALFYGMDPLVLANTVLAFVEVVTGRPDRAEKLCREAHARATELSHLYSNAFSLCGTASVHQMRRGAAPAEAAALELSTMCREHGFTEMLGWGEWVRGWAMLEQGRADRGVEIMAESITLHESIGGTPGAPWRRGVLAEGYARAGRLDDAREELRRAVEAADQMEQHFVDAELCRIGGELALRSAPADDKAAEGHFRKAIALANRQDAKWWELRATLSLARLLRDTGRRDEARSLLSEIYNWFTEGFDTADLNDAKVLLDELGA